MERGGICGDSEGGVVSVERGGICGDSEGGVVSVDNTEITYTMYTIAALLNC